MSRPASAANALSVSNTKLAACLAALGFRCDCKPLHDVATGRDVREFLFTGGSVRPEFATLTLAIARSYESGALARSDPMHPLCVMMRAQHNYDRILDMHKGAVMNLRSVQIRKAGSDDLVCVATEYRRGTALDPDSRFSGRVSCDDLCLVAALAAVGLPVRDFDGPEGRRRYWLPRFGYAVQSTAGQMGLADAELLLRRAPTARDTLRLQLEDTCPLHPVVLGYEALLSRAVLKKLLHTTSPILHVSSLGRDVLLSTHHTGRIMDEITARLGAPPL